MTRTDEYYDALADERYSMPPKRRTGCACFSPGEVGGTCPGRENCPIADEHDEEEYA